MDGAVMSHCPLHNELRSEIHSARWPGRESSCMKCLDSIMRYSTLRMCCANVEIPEVSRPQQPPRWTTLSSFKACVQCFTFQKQKRPFLTLPIATVQGAQFKKLHLTSLAKIYLTHTTYSCGWNLLKIPLTRNRNECTLNLDCSLSWRQPMSKSQQLLGKILLVCPVTLYCHFQRGPSQGELFKYRIPRKFSCEHTKHL